MVCDCILLWKRNNNKNMGAVRLLSGQARLTLKLKLTTCVWFPGPTWLKHRTKSCKLSSDLHRYAGVCIEIPPINTPNKAIKENRLMLGSKFRLKFDEPRWTGIRKFRNDQKEPHGDGIRECGVWNSSRLLRFSLMSPKQSRELPRQSSITFLL